MGWAVNLNVRLLTIALRATAPNRVNMIEPSFCFLLPNYRCLDLFTHSRTESYSRKIAWIRHKIFNRSPMSTNRGGLVVLLKPVLNESSKSIEEVKQLERTSPEVNCSCCIGTCTVV